MFYKVISTSIFHRIIQQKSGLNPIFSSLLVTLRVCFPCGLTSDANDEEKTTNCGTV